jgi:acyl-CoA synthetase (AMP-forming)/AMP-acid ligase II
MRQVLTNPQADLFTPYGATECLPVASIGGKQVLDQTASKTRLGAGTCVGKVFPGVALKIIRISDQPISSMHDAEVLPSGEIGEIVVRSPSVTKEYYKRPEPTALAKIPDAGGVWHRMGDVGYLDEDGLLWFCGRKAHIATTASGPMYSVCCEAIFNEHPGIYRTALVGIGPAGQQTPVLIAEPEPGMFPETPDKTRQLVQELREIGQQHELTRTIDTVLLHRSLPVDPRHNVKINREELADWALRELNARA